MKGIIHPLLEGDETLTEGYRIATEHEFGTMDHATNQHRELVEAWQLLLTMYWRALGGEWTYPGDPGDGR